MSRFNIIAYIDEIQLTSRLIKICQQHDYQLLLPERTEIIADSLTSSSGLILADLDEAYYSTDDFVKPIRSGSAFPLVGIIERIQAEKARGNARGLYDLIIPKSLLEQNLSVIINQVQNGS